MMVTTKTDNDDAKKKTCCRFAWPISQAATVNAGTRSMSQNQRKEKYRKRRMKR